MPPKSPLVRSLALMLLAALLATQCVPATRAAGTRATMVVGSLQAAADSAIPGDILLLRETTYAEQVTIRRSGTALRQLRWRVPAWADRLCAAAYAYRVPPSGAFRIWMWMPPRRAVSTPAA